MTHGSLFSGIGGAEYAAQMAAWENVFHCEINPFGRKILDYYWPKATSYADIKQTDFTIWRGRIDVLTGGFPCQPFSVAGKRKGTADDRHLWPEMLRAILEIQPRYIVGENVRGFINWNGGLVFDQVLSDLENEGYEVAPFLLPACSVNAPHRRDRIWIVAYNSKQRCDNRSDNREKRHIQDDERTTKKDKSERKRWKCRSCQIGDIGITSYANQLNGNLSGFRTGEVSQQQTAGIFENNAPNSNSRRQPGEEYRKEESGQFAEAGIFDHWQNFPTQSPICSGDDGFSRELDGITLPKWRNESIKGYGNAWVPQVAYEIFKVINQMEKL